LKNRNFWKRIFGWEKGDRVQAFLETRDEWVKGIVQGTFIQSGTRKLKVQIEIPKRIKGGTLIGSIDKFEGWIDEKEKDG